MILIYSDIGSEIGFEIAALKEMIRRVVSVQMWGVTDVVQNLGLVVATFYFVTLDSVHQSCVVTNSIFFRERIWNVPSVLLV